jgi:hypothetical protein
VLSLAKARSKRSGIVTIIIGLSLEGQVGELTTATRMWRYSSLVA